MNLIVLCVVNVPVLSSACLHVVLSNRVVIAAGLLAYKNSW
jgi:hypothetical protein